MEKFKKVVGAAAFLLAFMSASIVFGQEPRFMTEKEAVNQNTRYMSGGVGIGERQAMEKMAEGYDLKLVFATIEGNYLSFVDVKITDQKGNQVLTAQSNGPWFYADLPPGSYKVSASHNGVEKSHNLVLDSGLEEVVLHWKQEQAG
ncbi:MAG: carboxypeptidase regulatory-like domain-containing protein [Desulfobacteraceae bacterium]|nr:MAG: carboxypeptidase regulatory-like domain-containing protein [Desulfobacteraceae bacterium]